MRKTKLSHFGEAAMPILVWAIIGVLVYFALQRFTDITCVKIENPTFLLESMISALGILVGFVFSVVCLVLGISDNSIAREIVTNKLVMFELLAHGAMPFVVGVGGIITFSVFGSLYHEGDAVSLLHVVLTCGISLAFLSSFFQCASRFLKIQRIIIAGK